MAAGRLVYKESDGRSVTLTTTYAVDEGSLCYIGGFIGIAERTAAAGEQVALNIEPDERQLEVGASLNPALGDIIYIDVPNIGSAHMVPSAAILKATATGARAFGRCVEAEDSNNVVRVIRYWGI